MRKVLLALFSLVNVVLVSVAFGITAQTAVTNNQDAGFANYYQLVFERGSNPFALVSFILLVAGAAVLLVCLIPTKFRKFVLPVDAALFIAAGVFMLLAPHHVDTNQTLTVTGSMTAASILVLVAGGISCFECVLEFLKKKEAK